MYFLPLASFYISYMEKMRRHSFNRSSPHFYAFRYFILFTDSDRLFFIVIIFHPLGISSIICRCIFFFCLDLRICFLPLVPGVSDTFSSVSDTFLSDSSTGFLYLLKISMNSFPVIVSRWIKNSAASSRMSIFSRNVCDCFGVSFF